MPRFCKSNDRGITHFTASDIASCRNGADTIEKINGVSTIQRPGPFLVTIGVQLPDHGIKAITWFFGPNLSTLYETTIRSQIDVVTTL